MGLIREARDYIRSSASRLPEDEQTPQFSPGDRVLHSHLGPGRVMETDAENEAYLIHFDVLPTPRKISFKVKLSPDGK